MSVDAEVAAGSSGRSSSRHKVAHIGVAVKNLEEAVAFYRVFLQVDPVSELWEADQEPFLNELVGYQAKMKEAMFPLGNALLELLEYEEPRPGRMDPETFNVGHMHCCLQVDDVQAEYERLRDANLGIEFRSEGPVEVPESDPDYKGEKYLYLRTPDGSTFELYEARP